MATLSVGGTTVFDGSALQSGVTGNTAITGLGTVATGTLGAGVRFPQGAITNVISYSTSVSAVQNINDNFTDIATGSSVSYTPTTGARYVVFEYICAVDNKDSRGIWAGRIELDGEYHTVKGGTTGYDSSTLDQDFGIISIAKHTFDLSTITTVFSGHSSHDWQTKQGGTSAFNAGTVRLAVAVYNSSYEVSLHKIENGGNTSSGNYIFPSTTIYSIM